MGGTGFRVPGRISKNQIALRTTALADTGANGHIFCNTAKAHEAINYCGAKTTRLPNAIPVTDYAGRPGKRITHGITMNLELDGVMYPNIFMLVTDCGKHDLLIGFHFFARYQILLDPANKKLIQRVQDTPSFARTITVQPPKAEDPQARKEYQEDAGRRDALFQTQEQPRPRRILARRDKTPTPMPMQSGIREDPAPDNIDIALIGGPAFHRNLKQPGSKSGYLSIAALDTILAGRHLEDHPLDDEENA